MRRLVLAAAVVALASACQTEKQAQTASLLAAVERFQRGENRDRPALAAEVARVPCSDSAVAPACAACVKATGAMGGSIALKVEVEKALDRLEAGTLPRAEAEGMHLDQKLTEAMRLAEEARAAMPDCETRLNALRR